LLNEDVVKMSKRTLVSFDWAVKRFLRNKASFGILNGFLSELLKQDISVSEILESEGNQEDENDKYNRLDLLCRDTNDELIIIEVQFFEESDYFHRCLYATSKVITEYISKSDAYQVIRKVYSINILYFDLGHGSDYIYRGRTEFVGSHNGEQLELSERQKSKFGKTMPSEIFPEYYMLKVNNFDDVAKSTLDEWIYFLKNTELPANYSAKGLSLVENQLKYDNMDTATKQQYDQYLKEIRISQDMIESAVDRGKLEGKIEGKVEVVIKGFDNDLSIGLLTNITQLTEEEVVKILKEHGRIK
jgi:predicted transposase/invertase (TIGR01784 family)